MFIIHTHNMEGKTTERIAVVNCAHGFWVLFLCSFSLFCIACLYYNQRVSQIATVHCVPATSRHRGQCSACIFFIVTVAWQARYCYPPSTEEKTALTACGPCQRSLSR